MTEQGYKHLLSRIRLLSAAASLSSTLTFTLQNGITESLHQGPLSVTAIYRESLSEEKPQYVGISICGSSLDSTNGLH